MKLIRTLGTALMLGTLLAAVGCNTIHGMGQDVAHGGQKVEHAATSTQESMHNK